MKTVFKRLMVYILVLSSIFVSPGCSETRPGLAAKPAEKAAKAQDKASKVNIQITQCSQGYQRGLEEAIKKYNSENTDGIMVTLLQLPKFKYTEVMNMLMTSGDGPDIISIGSEWLDTYINRNWVLNISKYVDDGFLKKFPDWAVRFSGNPAFKGNFYTIPATMITSRLIYNKDLFKMAGLDPERPPKTLAELEEYALKISNEGLGSRKYGLALPLGDEWAGFVQSMEMPFTYSGIYYYGFKEGAYNLNSYEKWLKLIAGLKSKGGLYPGENTIKIDTIRAQFAEGNIGMMFATSWDPAVLNSQYTTRCSWGVAMPPAMDEASIGKGKAIVLPGVCYAVNPNTANKELTMKVWRYLYSKECLGEQFRQGGELPVPLDIMQDPAYKPDFENYADFFPGKNDSPYPNVPTGGGEWERFAVYLEAFENIENAGNILEKESISLNEAFRNRAMYRAVVLNNYMNSNFDPKNPLN